MSVYINTHTRTPTHKGDQHYLYSFRKKGMNGDNEDDGEAEGCVQVHQTVEIPSFDDDGNERRAQNIWTI